MAQLPRKQFTQSKLPNPHFRKTSTPSFRISAWRSYPEHNLRTASRQARALGKHHKIFAECVLNAIYTQPAAKPGARKTSTPNFRVSVWRSYPEHRSHRACRQARMPGRHQRQVFAFPHGAATPNTLRATRLRPECQENIKFSNLRMVQLPRTQFTHSKPPSPRAGKTSQNFCRVYTERNLHTASRQTGCQEDITKFSRLRVAQLPRTPFTQSMPPSPRARKTSTSSFRISAWRSYPEHIAHSKAQTRMPGNRQQTKNRFLHGAATPNDVHTQQTAESSGSLEGESSGWSFRRQIFLTEL